MCLKSPMDRGKNEIHTTLNHTGIPMNTGLSLTELAAKIEAAQSSQRDLLVPNKSLEVITAGDAIGLDVKGTAIVQPTPLAWQQIATHLRIPKAYWDRMAEEDHQLLATNANRWLSRSDDTRMLRLQGNDMRAYVSNAYKRLDHPVALRETLEVLQAAETPIVPLSTNVDPYGERMDLKILFPEVQGEVKPGDNLRAGIAISNSETGGGSYTVVPFMYRDYCTNGMIFGKQTFVESLRRRHVGARLESIWQDDTMQVEAELLGKQTRDMVTALSSQESFDRLLETCREAANSTPIEDPEAAVQVLAKDYRLNEVERSKVLINLIEDQDYSKWGLANAVTKVANDSENYSRSTELESMGSQLMTLQMRQWERIRIAA